MNFHTLIPELKDYIFAILLTWCLGSSNLASHLYSRYFVNSAINPLVIQCVVKGLICLVVLTVLSINDLFATTIGWQLISIPLGLLVGWFVVKVELIINRFVQRRNNRNMFIPRYQSNYYYLRAGPGSAILSLAPAYRFLRKTNLKKLHEHYATHESRRVYFSLVTILLIAVFEEIIFRGYLVQCCKLLPDIMCKIALVITTIVFGVSHASFGLWQIIAKIILGGCCMATVLICHTVLPALIVHGYLNWVAFRCQYR